MVNLVGDVTIHRPWILVQILPNLKTHILARFCNRQDADDHLRVLRRFVPKAAFAIVFEPPVKPELEERG